MTPISTRAVCKAIAATLLVAAFAACHYAPKVEENGLPRPEDYKEPIQDFVRGQHTDPTGIRNAFVSEPSLRPVAGNTTRYVICFKYEAKDDNDRRRYAASREVAAIFYDRRVSQFTGATPELCGQAVYQPFPELQRLCREKVCAR